MSYLPLCYLAEGVFALRTFGGEEDPQQLARSLAWTAHLEERGAGTGAIHARVRTNGSRRWRQNWRLRWWSGRHRGLGVAAYLGGNCVWRLRRGEVSRGRRHGWVGEALLLIARAQQCSMDGRASWGKRSSSHGLWRPPWMEWDGGGGADCGERRGGGGD
jgi:hypothetical protein